MGGIVSTYMLNEAFRRYPRRGMAVAYLGFSQGEGHGKRGPYLTFRRRPWAGVEKMPWSGCP